MQDATWTRAVFARWYVLVGGLLVTVVLCVLAVGFVPPRYQLTSSVLLLPTTSASGAAANPYLALGGLQATADVVARTLSDEETARQIRREAGTDTYTVTRDASTAGPVLLVVADGRNAATSTRLLRAVLEAVPRSVSSLQEAAGVPPEARFGTSVIARDDQPVRQTKSVIRAVLVTAAGGVVLTLLVAGLLEGWCCRAGLDVPPGQAPRPMSWRTGQSGPALAPSRSLRLTVRTAPLGTTAGGP